MACRTRRQWRLFPKEKGLLRFKSEKRLLRFRSEKGNSSVKFADVKEIGAAHGRKKLVVIGNGMAGVKCVEEVTNLEPDRYEIVIYGTEPRPNYNRIMLSKYSKVSILYRILSLITGPGMRSVISACVQARLFIGLIRAGNALRRNLAKGNIRHIDSCHRIISIYAANPGDR